MKLLKPIVFLDIESATVGPRPDPAKDRIVHLYIDFIRDQWSSPPADIMLQFNPGFAMSAENIDCHGITNEMAAHYPGFQAHHAKFIADSLSGCDIGGFNHSNYDIPLLWEEAYRVGVELNFEGVNFIDVGTIFKKKEERSLEAAVQFYCGRPHQGAHDCRLDVMETINVFNAQLKRYPDLEKMTAAELGVFSRHEERLDLAGKIVKGPDGEPVYNFGKSRGVRVVDDPGFGYWMLDKDFSENTKRVVRRILGVGAEVDSDESDLPWNQG